MTSRADLLRRLVEVADDLGPIVAPVGAREQLTAGCRTLRLALGAAACSIARLDEETLIYEASDGEGAGTILGTRLPITRGVAGYVASTGQSLAIDHVAVDPRFARDVAERTGYVPTALIVVPVLDSAESVIGVLSVLDPTVLAVDTLGVASAAAAQAAWTLATIDGVMRLGPMLVRALADAASVDGTLAAGLRRQADRLPEPDRELVALTALLAELRAAPPAVRIAAERVLREFLGLASSRRR